jgi:hypothetical protein
MGSEETSASMFQLNDANIIHMCRNLEPSASVAAFPEYSTYSEGKAKKTLSVSLRQQDFHIHLKARCTKVDTMKCLICFVYRILPIPPNYMTKHHPALEPGELAVIQ